MLLNVEISKVNDRNVVRTSARHSAQVALKHEGKNSRLGLRYGLITRKSAPGPPVTLATKV